MLFGNLKNNLMKPYRIGLIAFLFFNNAFLVACQTNEDKIASTLKKCEVILNEDRVQDAFKCYFDAALANHKANDSIEKSGTNVISKI